MPTLPGIAIFTLVPFLYTTWLYEVNQTIQEPYLDEVFHVRQAQAYCAGKFATWDPKITTPPGLYIWSYLFLSFRNLIFGGDDCGLADLRWLNALVAIFIIPAQIWDLNRQLGLSGRNGQNGQDDRNTFHTVMNICLFPLLFFFSGLYYTDVCSVSLVLDAYQYHIRYLRGGSVWRSIQVFTFGISALWMRQTNIFWVAIFLAGLDAVHYVKRANRPPSDGSVDFPALSGAIYDPLVGEAYLEDYPKTAVSLVVTALKDPISLLLKLWLYLAILASFTIFVLINGGVVLGDKENHVASIHIPQMLYIWPYIVFFSWPVILPHVIPILFGDLSSLKSRLPRPIVAITILAIMALAVHFNTIVHPFTLADNRHYVFYVFRLLLRHPLVKYVAVPIYFICAWAAITALGNGPAPRRPHSEKPAHPVPKAQSTDEEMTPKPTHTSFLLVYLTSTTLSLITAPLVEPRYFILPWLIWRLHVQSPPPRPSHQAQSTSAGPRLLGRILQLSENRSIWLYIETAWFLLVNLGTCYVFLYRGFEWEQEIGRVQRFMW